MEKESLEGDTPREPEEEMASEKGGNSNQMSETMALEVSPVESMSTPRRLWYTLISLQKWRNRSAAKQKKIRELENKVRDLSRSRNYWKEEAEQAAGRIQTMEAKKETSQANEPSELEKVFFKKS